MEKKKGSSAAEDIRMNMVRRLPVDASLKREPSGRNRRKGGGQRERSDLQTKKEGLAG